MKAFFYHMLIYIISCILFRMWYLAVHIDMAWYSDCVFQLPIVDDELKKAAGENKEDGRLEKHTTLN